LGSMYKTSTACALRKAIINHIVGSVITVFVSYDNVHKPANSKG